jgi:hypothetical protein
VIRGSPGSGITLSPRCFLSWLTWKTGWIVTPAGSCFYANLLENSEGTIEFACELDGLTNTKDSHTIGCILIWTMSPSSNVLSVRFRSAYFFIRAWAWARVSLSLFSNYCLSTRKSWASVSAVGEMENSLSIGGE